jgi:hypothetical protein
METNSQDEDKENTSKYLEEDVKILAKWAREELFNNIKFLYRGKEDLEPRGMVFELFVKQCSQKLRGLGAAQENGEESTETYLRLVWAMAAKKQTLGAALSLRRRCVYTVMQNRFNGMCLRGSSSCV